MMVCAGFAVHKTLAMRGHWQRAVFLGPLSLCNQINLTKPKSTRVHSMAVLALAEPECQNA